MMSEKSERYKILIKQIQGLLDPRCGRIANYANVCAAIQQEFEHWWCGFYFVNDNNQLELGPFQGPVACTLIEFNRGVCGNAWAKKEPIIVPDVHQYAGHIACSAESNSEIVIPILQAGKVTGVLDIDSIEFGAFDSVDQKYLLEIVKLL